MGVIFTCCPDCGGSIQTRNVVGSLPELCRCPACKTVWVKGDTKRFKFDEDDLSKLLRDRHEAVVRNTLEERTKQLIESDDDDVRWTRS